MNIVYKICKPGEINVKDLEQFLIETDNHTIPPLSTLVNIKEYACKLAERATLFVAFDNFRMIGLSAVYVNKAPLFSFGTYLCVKKKYQDDMVGVELIMKSIEYCKEYGTNSFRGEIRKSNKPLWNFYKRLGFTIVDEKVYPNTDIYSLIIELKF